ALRMVSPNLRSTSLRGFGEWRPSRFLALCQRPLEPIGNCGQCLLARGSTHQQSDVPGLELNGVSYIRADQIGQRRHRGCRCHVVVLTVDIEERTRHPGELAWCTIEQHLAGEHSILAAQFPNH